jgi:hypothetical protein
MKIKIVLQEICSGILGGVLAYFGVGFLQNFYPSILEFVLITILLHGFFAIVLELIFEGSSSASAEASWSGKIITAFSAILGIAFLALTIRLLLQYPAFFSLEFFLLKPGFLPAFLVLIVASKAGMVLLLNDSRLSDWRSSKIAGWTKGNLPGLILSCAIASSTFAIGTVFAQPGMVKTDNFFETDSVEWLNRLTADVEQLTNMRPVHPFAFLILRPLAWFVMLALQGDRIYSAFLLNSAVGGACVFLTWLFFRQRTDNKMYALLVAALLGFSTSHLLLIVFLESYIYSAAALIAFLLLLQRRDKPLAPLVFGGLLTFGITVTNFIQTCILFFLETPHFKTISKYIAIVVTLALFLAIVQDMLYPSSDPFYIPASYYLEGEYRFDIFEVERWNLIGRANTLVQSIFAFSVVAPQPLILLEEIGCTYPCIQTYYYDRQGNYFISSYEGFGQVLALLWVIMMLGAGTLFVMKFVKSPRSSALPAALLLTLLFNFILHMNYGDDFMLYSPDWTYALVFFLGIAYQDLSKSKWMYVVLLLFLTGLMVNNLNLFRDILDAILPFP